MSALRMSQSFLVDPAVATAPLSCCNFARESADSGFDAEATYAAFQTMRGFAHRVSVALPSFTFLVSTNLEKVRVREQNRGMEPQRAADQELDSPEAVPDPHYLELRRGVDLPASYMPPSMGGAQPRWIRIVAAIVVAVFIGATAAGVCLTYGPKFF